MKKQVTNQQILDFMSNARTWLDSNPAHPLFDVVEKRVKALKSILESLVDQENDIRAKNAFINGQGLVEFETLPNQNRVYKMKPEQDTAVRTALRALSKGLQDVEVYYSPRIDFFGSNEVDFNTKNNIVPLRLSFSWKEIFTPFVIPENPEELILFQKSEKPVKSSEMQLNQMATDKDLG